MNLMYDSSNLNVYTEGRKNHVTWVPATDLKR